VYLEIFLSPVAFHQHRGLAIVSPIQPVQSLCYHEVALTILVVALTNFFSYWSFHE